VEGEVIRIYAYAALAIAIVGLLGYGIHLKHKADRAEAAEHALSDYQGAVAAREKQEASDRAADQVRRKTLSDTLDHVASELTDLRAHPPKQAVRYVQAPGATAIPTDCPPLRLDPDWVSSFNAGSQASALPHP
jgi:D-serine deaminase-like pyridoxal phosphate-dependent protein